MIKYLLTAAIIATSSQAFAGDNFYIVQNIVYPESIDTTVDNIGNKEDCMNIVSEIIDDYVAYFPADAKIVKDDIVDNIPEAATSWPLINFIYTSENMMHQIQCLQTITE